MLLSMRKCFFRKISQINLDTFNCFLENELATNLANTSDDFQKQIDAYNNCLVSTLDIFAPLQRKTVVSSSKILSPPWMDTEYKKERSLRRKFERQQKKYGDYESKERYVK